eukprot:TRINITY_DN10803_c0_g1_i1.p1 TRINITY_DN10803_c0_g1~~TRINITY_DN10803_c0_g1_i1.p1  ORF type:complete len:415 (+),score=188.17 TRINITY_DN10803_c0_g1_i1:119-1363(+)
MSRFEPVKYLSQRYSGRQPSAIRSIVQKNMGVPGMLSLAGGLPNPLVFPFTSMKVTVAGGKELEVPADQLKLALQYSSSTGMPKLNRQLLDMQKRYHAPQGDVKLLIGTGSQSLLAQGFDMLLNPGDSLLVEAPTYPGALAALQPIKPNFVPITIDKDGIIPSVLEEVLDKWDSSAAPKPRVLYTIPTGQNPSGATIAAERRTQIYSIAQKHDLVIVEDDPYYFLYLGEDGTQPQSFLSMDTDGRVLRFDSLSKVLSSGMRLGFVTAHPDFINAIEMDVQGTSLHTSNMGQVLASTLLEDWGEEGWAAHVSTVKAFYQERRGRFLHYCDKHLKGLAEWDVPEAGMFVWFTFPGVADTMDLISNKAREQKVLLVPGQSFFANDTPSNACRASYSLASDDDMDEALSRLATLIRNA